jgi:hypothetical protein
VRRKFPPELARAASIIGRDPGESPGTCCLLLRAAPITRKYLRYTYEIPPLLWVGNAPGLLARAPSPIIVAEGQWLKGNAKRRKAILSLALRGGIWLGATCNALRVPGYVLPVPIWKSLLFDGAQMDKYVHCNRIEKLLTGPERAALPIAGQHDALSAIGIAFAAYLLLTDLEKYREI